MAQRWRAAGVVRFALACQKLAKSCQNMLVANRNCFYNQHLQVEFGFQEYEEDKKRRLGEEGAKPKRIRYKPITR